MERLSNTRHPSGFSCRGLRIWGLILALGGIVGRGLLQNRLLGLNGLAAGDLLQVLESSDSAMTIATASLVMQLVETCAVPIFAWLLVTGAQNTSDLKKYALRVAAVAVFSELPYNLALGGKLVGYGPQNPVWGLLLALVMLVFFRQYEGKSMKNIAIRVAVAVAALVWATMLRVEFGGCTVVIVAALWITRKKSIIQNLFGAAAAMLCSVSNIFFMVSPMVFLAIHFCNGERDEQNKIINYLAYPVMLLAVCLCGMYLI